MENKGLIFLEQQRLTRADYINEEDTAEQLAYAKEKIREKVWIQLLKASKHNFYPVNVVAGTKEEPEYLVIGLRVDLLYRKHITAIEMKRFFDKMYTL